MYVYLSQRSKAGDWLRREFRMLRRTLRHFKPTPKEPTNMYKARLLVHSSLLEKVLQLPESHSIYHVEYLSVNDCAEIYIASEEEINTMPISYGGSELAYMNHWVPADPKDQAISYAREKLQK